MKQDNCSNAADVHVDSANDRSVNFTDNHTSGLLRHCLDSILFEMKQFGFKSYGYSSKPTLSHWKRCCDLVGSQMKFIKWKLPAFFAASCGQEVEESLLLTIDRPDCLLGGKAHRYIQRLKRDLTPLKWASFLASIKTGVKKGLTRPDVAACRQAEVDTFKVLTTPVVTPMQVHIPAIDMIVTKEKMISEIRRTCQEIFKGKEFSLFDRIRPFFPSTSANYINTRAMGGAVGAIMEHPDLLKGLKGSGPLCEFEVTINGTCLFKYKGLVDRFMILFMRMLKRAHLDITAVPLGLSEALKVRVITKGPFELYTVLKPLQKFMHSTMRIHPAFSLIGETINESYVNSRISQIGSGKVLSVDYRNATNEIFSWPSEVAADEISSLLNLMPEERALFKTSLTGHQIELRGEVKNQIRGQLMGSITSFPILCIINAAIMRYTFELSTNVTVDLANCPLAINGDDAILRGPETIFSIWKSVSGLLGLSPSNGKVYFSDQFCEMNSRTFLIGPSYVTIVPFINLGILRAMKRSSRHNFSDSSSEITSIGALAHAFLKEAPAEMHEQLLAEFIHYHKAYLTSLNLPWFLPEHLLGVGLPNVGRFCLDDFHRRLLYWAHDTKRPRQPASAWRCWSYASRCFPDYAYKYARLPLLEDTGDLEIQLDGSYLPISSIKSILAVQALFTLDGIKELFAAPKRKTMNSELNSYWKQIRKLWKDIEQRHGRRSGFAPPLSDFPASLNPDKVSYLPVADLSIPHTFDRHSSLTMVGLDDD